FDKALRNGSDCVRASELLREMKSEEGRWQKRARPGLETQSAPRRPLTQPGWFPAYRCLLNPEGVQSTRAFYGKQQSSPDSRVHNRWHPAGESSAAAWRGGVLHAVCRRKHNNLDMKKFALCTTLPPFCRSSSGFLKLAGIFDKLSIFQHQNAIG